MSDLIPIERIESKIIVIRDRKVLLDSDLAILYGVSVGRLNEAVKRKLKRFPSNFMFQLNSKEFTYLKSQIAIASLGHGGRRTPPYAFTEQGVAMLSSVLNSERAIQVNIAIMNTFVQMRQIIRNDEFTKARLEDIEDRLGTQEFQTLAIIDQLGSIKKKLKSPKNSKPKIGFPEKK
jgi:hypothetical protein